MVPSGCQMAPRGVIMYARGANGARIFTMGVKKHLDATKDGTVQ